MTTRPPGPKGNPLLGSLLDFARNPGNFLLETARQFGDVAYFRILNLHFYLLTNPDDIRDLLVTQADKFRKSKLDYDIFSRFLGIGLLTNEGAAHSRQRRLALLDGGNLCGGAVRLLAAYGFGNLVTRGFRKVAVVQSQLEGVLHDAAHVIVSECAALFGTPSQKVRNFGGLD